nr:ATP-binding protein [Brucella pituitosa]
MPLDIVLHTPRRTGPRCHADCSRHPGTQGQGHSFRAALRHVGGGTLIALAADEIVMCDHSVLGPIDPQLGEMPAASLIRVVEQKPITEIDDQTLVLADVGRKAIAQVETVADAILDRVVHNAHRINLEGDSMRKAKSGIDITLSADNERT